MILHFVTCCFFIKFEEGIVWKPFFDKKKQISRQSVIIISSTIWIYFRRIVCAVVIDPSVLKVVDSYRIFSTKWSDTFGTLFAYGKEQESEKKYIITVQKKFTFLRRFDCKIALFEISKSLIQKACFQNDSKCKKIMSR